ncbi:MAG TPA: hypothetical protein VIQ30_16610 [Pseudonocardia sp.]
MSRRVGRTVLGPATTGAAVLAVAATASAHDVALTAFSVPHLSGDYVPHGPPSPGDQHSYRGHDWDGNRDRRGGWDGHPWRWWHDSGITGARCRDGGGHVDWNRRRCYGRRYDGFHVR